MMKLQEEKPKMNLTAALHLQEYLCLYSKQLIAGPSRPLNAHIH